MWRGTRSELQNRERPNRRTVPYTKSKRRAGTSIRLVVPSVDPTRDPVVSGTPQSIIPHTPDEAPQDKTMGVLLFLQVEEVERVYGVPNRPGYAREATHTHTHTRARTRDRTNSSTVVDGNLLQYMDNNKRGDVEGPWRSFPLGMNVTGTTTCWVSTNSNLEMDLETVDSSNITVGCFGAWGVHRFVRTRQFPFVSCSVGSLFVGPNHFQGLEPLDLDVSIPKNGAA